MKKITILLIILFAFFVSNAQMILEYNTNLIFEKDITISLRGAVDVVIDWGDGSLADTVTTAGIVKHNYSVDGIYIVEIAGSLEQFGGYIDYNDYFNIENLTKVISFGNLGITSFNYAFRHARNLTEVPTSIPSTVTDLSCMFYGAYKFNQDISNWNVSNVTNMAAMFNGASAFNQDISNWDVSNVTNMSSMFYGAYKFNQDIGNWNVGNVNNMSNMFRSAPSFHQNIANWNISNVSNMSYMFFYDTLSTINYDALLNAWASQTLQANVQFHGGQHSIYSCNSKAARDILTSSPNNWYILDGGIDALDNTIIQDSATFTSNTTNTGVEYQWLNCDDGYTPVTGATNQTYTATEYSSYSVEVTLGACRDTSDCMSFYTDKMILEYNTNLGAGTEITLPLKAAVDVVINWGDGSIDTVTVAGNVNHTYLVDGTYKVEITGNLEQFGGNINNIEKLTKALSFGDIGITNLDSAFYNAINLKQAPTIIPSTVTSVKSMFENASSFNQNINNWDVSNVTNMSNMFAYAYSFDQDISSWKINHVCNMFNMFKEDTLSITNYDALLNSWAHQLPCYGVHFDGGYSKYSCNSETSRNMLTNQDWNISDGGEVFQMTIDNTISQHKLSYSSHEIFTSNATNVDIAYQWLNCDYGYTPVTGATNQTYTASKYSSYSVEVTLGSCVDTSNCLSFYTDKMILEYNTNLGAGTEITLPLRGDVNVIIDWGDNSPADTVTTAGDVNHTYLNNFIVYAVEITGSLEHFGGSVNNITKLTKVLSFGNIGITSLDSALYNAVNLTEVPTIIPSTVTSVKSMFENASSFNQNIINWDVSNVTNMSNMFAYASSFDQDISSWEVANVTDMSNMFIEDTLSTVNYDALLNKWATQTVQSNLSFNGGYSKYSCNSEFSRNILTSTPVNWTITDGGEILQMTIDNTIIQDSALFSSNAVGLGIEYQWLNCDNGYAPITGATSQNYTATELGSYAVEATIGSCVDTSDCYKLHLQRMVLVFNTNLGYGTNIRLSLKGDVDVVINWGDGSPYSYVTTSTNISHYYSTNGIYTVEIAGELEWFAGLIDCNEFLTNVTSFGDLEIERLSDAFRYATNLIEVPTVLPTTVTNLSYMFDGATAFNQDISSWDVSNVTNMSGMFKNANLFNQYLNSWNVSNVTNMSYMFNNATSFNQNISNWDVGNVTNMLDMFNNASAFHQYLSNWDVSNVTNMSGMFKDASLFCQYINGWDVGNVTNMSNMFYNATSFNQNIGSWDVSNVTNMSYMFYNANLFNQDIGSWDVKNVSNMYKMFYNNSLSTINYDKLLNGWSTHTLHSNIHFYVGNVKYSCDAENARNILTSSPNNWEIIDGGELFQTDNNIMQLLTSLISNISGVGVEYQWLNCDNGYAPIAGAIAQSYQPEYEGDYAVEVTFGACIDTSNCYTYHDTLFFFNLNSYFDIDQTVYLSNNDCDIDYDNNIDSVNIYNYTLFNDTTIEVTIHVYYNNIYSEVIEYINIDTIGVYEVISTISCSNKNGNSIVLKVTDYINIEILLGVNKLSYQDIKLYPNPSHGSFTVEGESIENITIFNVNGQSIKKVQNIKLDSQINITNLDKGFYIIKIETKKGIVNKKISVN